MSDAEDLQAASSPAAQDDLESSQNQDDAPVKAEPVRGSKHALDDDEEDDDEEEEEEEDEIDDRKPRKKVRRSAVDAFIDREAEVDDDDEDLDDEEEEQEIAEGFIENEDTADSPGARDDRRHRELDQKRGAIEEEEAEKLAARFKEQYGRSGNRAYRGDTQSVPQRLLLPSVEDPSIWAIRVKQGKESDIVFNLLRKQADRERSDTPLAVISVFQRAALSGYIYAEARRQADVIEALTDVVGVYVQNQILIPVKEMPELLRVRKTGVELVPGSYIRIKNKNKRYAGDLGQIDNIYQGGTSAVVKLVPRLDYSSKEMLLKKNVAKSANRAPARLFNANDVEKVAEERIRGNAEENLYEFNGERYEDGFLVKEFKLDDLIQEDIKPTLEELHLFSQNGAFDLANLKQGLQGKDRVRFTIGDNVEVISGEQTGAAGIVQSISNGVVELKTSAETGLGVLSVPAVGLRKKFAPGSHVRVQGGKHSGESGMVVATSGNSVTLISDMTTQEISVFARDLGEVNEVSGAPVRSRYEVQDLVTLNATEFGCVVKLENDLLRVLMAGGEVRVVKADSVAMKLEVNKQVVTTDRNGLEVKIQDRIREVEGDSRKGEVFHIHLGFVFSRNVALLENNGIFVSRNRSIVNENTADAAKVDLTKMNPALGQMQAPAQLPKSTGRDRAIGQTVWIRTGPMKGIMGIIKDSTDTTARVELHSRNKIATFNKLQLGFKLQRDGKLMSYSEWLSARGGSMGSGGQSYSRGSSSLPGDRPAWAQSGGRTPGGSLDNNFGSRTPAWAASGGSRTPAWAGGAGGATPAWAGAGGSRTPAYGGSTGAWAGGGSKTPTWNSGGNATPAWNAGSRTPAYGGGGQATPAWQGGGGRTPAYGTPYGDAPSVNDGAYAATPAAAPDYAPTPGAGQTWEDDWDATNIHPSRLAQTPAAATPGVYGDAAPTPGYLPESP
ncbi:hypothetical protein BCR37DRAFT_354700 [Protomyces lactucae-debilis]|uniref:Transcription elongation factor SPT5 n=1 Tax=Protomyces lactucae-debilis TaxID=2754530 RepID=A0A1Y2FQD7_PROLT|nr:uncharacterized protein BCR37DRAFT_354700 [Protomyces lactucae-debilis]ORY86212.1 hypothetical protein BCR37DRAFT_354700 [Protomyces lactucae-debilis]